MVQGIIQSLLTWRHEATIETMQQMMAADRKTVATVNRSVISHFWIFRQNIYQVRRRQEPRDIFITSQFTACTMKQYAEIYIQSVNMLKMNAVLKRVSICYADAAAQFLTPCLNCTTISTLLVCSTVGVPSQTTTGWHLMWIGMLTPM